jgi:hypothetical protein
MILKPTIAPFKAPVHALKVMGDSYRIPGLRPGGER